MKTFSYIELSSILTKDEQKLFEKYSNIVYPEMKKKLWKSNFSSNTGISSHIMMVAQWMKNEKSYVLIEKLLNYALNNSDDITDTHFIYNHLIEASYIQREQDENALQRTVDYCLSSIKLYTLNEKKILKALNLNKEVPRVPAFKQLAIIYEKPKQFEKAIDICELAIKFNQTDGTKGDFQGRIEKLKKKC